MLISKDVDLVKLQTELNNAGIVVVALGQTGDDLHTYDEITGAPVDLPEAARAIVEAHVPAIDAKQALIASDAGMARIAEDIVDLLVAEGHTFPQPVLDKIAERKALRQQLMTQ